MNCKLDILRALDVKSDSVMLPRQTVLNQVRYTARDVPSVAEFDKALQELEESRLVIAVTDDLNGVKKYRLADAGKAKLLEHS